MILSGSSYESLSVLLWEHLSVTYSFVSGYESGRRICGLCPLHHVFYGEKILSFKDPGDSVP